MKFSKKIPKVCGFLFIIGFVLILVSCTEDLNTSSNQGNGDGENEENQDNIHKETKEPETIRIAFHFGDDVFQTRFGLIEEKLDNVSIESIQLPSSRDETWTFLQELFADQTIPDIVITGDNNAINNLIESDSIQMLDELIEKSDFSLDVLNPSLISYIRSFDSDGRMIGMPDGVGFKGLHYNKEIFDLFGYEYPSGEMTWDEILDLATNMTGERNGQQYTGLTFHDYDIPLEQWAVNPVDAETEEVKIATDEAFKRHFEMLEKFKEIPEIDTSARRQKFIEGQAAMHIGFSSVIRNWEDFADVGMDDIDIAPIPVWDNGPKKHPYLGTTPMMILNESENVETAFEILLNYVSEENQLRISRQAGSGAVLTDENILSQYGAELPRYQGKNVAAFYAWPAAELKEQSQWDRMVDYRFDDFLESEDDVNTFLRMIQEETEAKIQEAKIKE